MPFFISIECISHAFREWSNHHQIQLDKLLIFLENLDIVLEDAKTKLFANSLQDEAQDWFIDLHIACIATFTIFVSAFRYEWGDERYQFFIGFNSLIKMEFRCFINLTRSFWIIMQGLIHYLKFKPEACALESYFRAFDSNIGLLLRKASKTMP